MFNSVKKPPSKKNGVIRAKSHFVTGLRHQTINSNTTGKTATEPLLSIAKMNATRQSPSQTFSARRDVPLTEVRRSSAFTNDNIESRKNSIANIFFRCAIQATDSTLTG